MPQPRKDQESPVGIPPGGSDAAQASNGAAAEKAKVRFESFLPREEAVSYFEAIVRGLKKGTIQFKQSEESLTLTPPSHIEIEVKAARKGGREKVSFEIGWNVEEPSDLTILPG